MIRIFPSLKKVYLNQTPFTILRFQVNVAPIPILILFNVIYKNISNFICE